MCPLIIHKSQSICVHSAYLVMTENHVSVFLSQLNAQISATTGTYCASKMTAGRYQRALQQFTGALQAGGLGTWLRKPPELGHLNISV